MNTRTMEYIITTAEERSQHKAAEKLLVSQPALSQQIRKTETEAGARFFARSGNELTLTDEGRIYINGARAVLSIYQDALKEIESIRARDKQQMTLVFDNSLSMYLPSILSVFSEVMPDIHVITIPANAGMAEDYIRSSFADLSLILTNEKNTNADSAVLYKDEICLVLPKGHKLKDDFTQNGIDFTKMSSLHFTLLNETSSLHRFSMRIFDQHSFFPRSLTQSDNILTVCSMIENGLAASLLPLRLCKEKGYDFFSLSCSCCLLLAVNKNHLLSTNEKEVLRRITEYFRS